MHSGERSEPGRTPQRGAGGDPPARRRSLRSPYGQEGGVPVDPFATATHLTRLLAAGEVTSRELIELHLERIERLDHRLNAVVTVDADGARRQADALDRRLARDGPVGPLHGLPMTVKDCWATAGMRTTAGSPEMADVVPDADAQVVGRLRAAAVVVGKTNVPEEVTGQETGNPLFGRTCNPWDPERTPGGSSGAAAAAVAAGARRSRSGATAAGRSVSRPTAAGSTATSPRRGWFPGGPPALGAGRRRRRRQGSDGGRAPGPQRRGPGPGHAGARRRGPAGRAAEPRTPAGRGLAGR
jgi:hypothetical protein